MDAYVFAGTATTQAITDVLALVGTDARAALPTPTGSGPELYVALTDVDAVELLTKIAAVVTTSGLTSIQVYLAYGQAGPGDKFPTQGVVDDYVGFALLTTGLANVVSVYEAALAVNGVVGAAMVSGGANVLVEVTSDSTTTLASMLSSVTSLTGVSSSSTCSGAVSAGAGFTTS